MFWIGFALGILATFDFLMTEHLIGQSKWKKKIAFAKSAFRKSLAISIASSTAMALRNVISPDDAR